MKNNVPDGRKKKKITPNRRDLFQGGNARKLGRDRVPDPRYERTASGKEDYGGSTTSPPFANHARLGCHHR